jgi:hypothetical protein
LSQELETDHQRHGFAGLGEFRSFIKRFEKAFEQEAANLTKDVLAKFAGKLYRESEACWWPRCGKERCGMWVA